jgi:diacylglycerol kinase family enzyme
LTPGKAAIVYHAGAGRGIAADLVATVRRRLETAHWEVIASLSTRAPHHAQDELAPFLADRCDLLVVIAGDGTLREICAGLCDRGISVPIGLVPAGNANVVARDQGIPLQPEQAIALLTEGRVRRLDVGTLRFDPQTNEILTFLAMVEIGFGARVVHLTQRLRDGWLTSLYRRWGDPVYLTAALVALVSTSERTLRIYRDSSPASLKGQAAVFANTRCYAKGWSMAPEARMDDGWLDLVVRSQSGIGVLLRTFHAARATRRPPPAFNSYHRGRRFRCQSETPMAVQMDGDTLPAVKWIEVGIAPGCLRLLTPS